MERGNGIDSESVFDILFMQASFSFDDIAAISKKGFIYVGGHNTGYLTKQLKCLFCRKTKSFDASSNLYKFITLCKGLQKIPFGDPFLFITCAHIQMH